MATLDAQTATAQALLDQLTAYASQPASPAADAVWAQMQPLLTGLGAGEKNRATPAAARQWLRDTKLPGLAGYRTLARRDMRYAEFGNLWDDGGRNIGTLVGDAEWTASRQQWEAEAVQARARGDAETAADRRGKVDAWYDQLIKRLVKARESETAKERPDHKWIAALDEDLAAQPDRKREALQRIDAVPLATDRAGVPAAAAGSAFELGRSAGQALRRTLEDLAQRVCLRTMEGIYR